jgi:15-cis-phytoene synthase
MQLHHQTSFECSKVITQHYSTSFSLGIKTLDKEIRPAIYAIYGMVRIADEIVDTFHDFDKRKLLQDFRSDTFRAINDQLSTNPILHAFQLTVNRYAIPLHLVEAFFNSMEMDLETQSYNSRAMYEEYIYGSAEVVGLMCLQVFCNGNQEQYTTLEPFARKLGAAFQKVNFLRDMKSDKLDRSRVYFPGIDLNRFDEVSKREIIADIQNDFDEALLGIRLLPDSSRKGVYLAYIYYRNLFKKIAQASVSEILEERIRVSDARKVYLFMNSMVRTSLNLV